MMPAAAQVEDRPTVIHARRVFVNSTAYLSFQLVARVLGIVSAILIARTLGVRDFGVFAYIASVVAVAGTLSDLGLDMAMIREVAKGGARLAQIVQAGLFLRYSAAFACTGVATLLAWFVAPHRYAMLLTLQIISLPLSVPFRCLAAYYIGSENLIAGAGLNVSQSMLNLAGIVVVRALHGGIAGICLAISISFAMVSVAGVVQLRRHLGMTVFARPEQPHLSRLFRSALEFAALSIATTLHYKVAPLLLGILAGSQAVGLFSAASRLTDSMMFLPAAIMGAILPTLSRAAPSSWEYREAIRRTAQYLSILCLPIAAVVTAIAPDIIRLLYGKQWAESSAPLAILAWGWAIICCTCALPTALNASRNTPSVIQAVALAILANCLAGLLLDRHFRAGGGASAVLAAEATAASYYLWRGRAKFGYLRLASRLWRPALCTAGMLGVMLFVKAAGHNFLWQLPLGIATYIAACAMVKPFDPMDVELMRGLGLGRFMALFSRRRNFLPARP
jgi:O-antigen/teichoic acid export membrane protein